MLIILLTASFLSLANPTLSEPSQISFGTSIIHDLEADPMYSLAWDIPRPYLPNHSYEQNQIMQYAYKVSKDKDFLYTLKAECGSISTDCVGVTRDRGICQLHPKYHAPFINSPGFKDWKNQVDYCWGVYQDAEKRGILKTTFYAYNVRQKVIKFFQF